MLSLREIDIVIVGAQVNPPEMAVLEEQSCSGFWSDCVISHTSTYSLPPWDVISHGVLMKAEQKPGPCPDVSRNRS